MFSMLPSSIPVAEGRYDYCVRVRGTVYLWGSGGVTQDVTFPNPLLLHISNDTFGEPVTLGTETAGGAHATLGTIQAGEHFTIPIQGLSGVVATCSPHSTVTCSLRRA
jgi:hypothetical protein